MKITIELWGQLKQEVRKTNAEANNKRSKKLAKVKLVRAMLTPVELKETLC